MPKARDEKRNKQGDMEKQRKVTREAKTLSWMDGRRMDKTQKKIK
jgi:hypothetical protein